MYSLRMSVWIVPRSWSRHPLLLADADVEREQHRGRRVDRHRGGDLVERDAREELLHVRERVDRDALAPDLAERLRMIGVVAHQGRHVEGGRESRLPVLEEVAEADVRLLGRAEAGELPHRPELPPVHRRVDPARVGVDARVAEVALVVGLDVVGRVERLDRQARHGREERVALGSGLVEVPAPGFGAVETRAVLGRGHGANLRAARAGVCQPSSSDRGLESSSPRGRHHSPGRVPGPGSSHFHTGMPPRAYPRRRCV